MECANVKKEMENRIKLCEEEAKVVGEKAKVKAEQVEILQQRLHDVSAGLKNADGNGSLLEQFSQYTKKEQEAATTITQETMKLKHLASVKAQADMEFKKVTKEQSSMNGQLEKVEREVGALQNSVDKLKRGYNPEMEASGFSNLERLRTQYKTTSDARRDLEAQISSRFQFQYKDPVSGFDRSRVKGLVAKLVNLKDPKSALALETVAGGRMYQVVVDTADTGKLLLEKGKLKTRVTVIPLNKISRITLHQDKVLKAQQIAGKDGKRIVQLALSLVGCENEVKAAMEYVFGKTLICDTSETAKAVSFHKEVKVKSVTLDGDVYDPSGTLTGGKAKGSGVCWLLKLQQLQELCVELGEMKAELMKLEEEQQALARKGKEYREMLKKLELKTHEHELLKEQFSLTEGAQLEARVKQLSQEIDQAEQALSDAKERASTTAVKLKEIKSEMKNAEAKRKGELKKLEAEIKTSKKASADASKVFKEKQQALKELTLERDELVKEAQSSSNQASIAEELLSKLELEAESLEAECVKARESYDESKAVLDEHKER